MAVKEQGTLTPGAYPGLGDFKDVTEQDLCNYDRYFTHAGQKIDNFDQFSTLLRNQFMFGAEKYKASDKGKEFTDLICEAFPGTCGVDWVLGTCMKYLGRYKNFGREKDLLKVATYMYILWLKGGFHKADNHDEDIER